MAEITGRRRGELVRGVFKVLMDNPDGLPAAQVSLTDAGREAYRSFPEPEVFEREAVRGYRAWEKE